MDKFQSIQKVSFSNVFTSISVYCSFMLLTHFFTHIHIIKNNIIKYVQYFNPPYDKSRGLRFIKRATRDLRHYFDTIL